MTLTHERLLEVLDYNPDTGKFTRKIFRSIGAANNNRHVEKRKTKDYSSVSVDGVPYQAHILAWFYVYKVWPTHNIDHIDRNRSNNRIDNLRLAIGPLNQINCKIHKHNTSGIKGVSWCNTYHKWTASVYANGKRINLGYFKDKDKAREARLAAEQEYYAPILKSDKEGRRFNPSDPLSTTNRN